MRTGTHTPCDARRNPSSSLTDRSILLGGWAGRSRRDGGSVRALASIAALFLGECVSCGEREREREEGRGAVEAGGLGKMEDDDDVEGRR